MATFSNTNAPPFIQRGKRTLIKRLKRLVMRVAKADTEARNIFDEPTGRTKSGVPITRRVREKR